MASESDSRMREFRDALYDALAGGGAARDADPLLLLYRLTEAGSRQALGDAAGAIDSLRQVATATSLEAALEAAVERFETPQRFRESIFFARCLERDPEPALALLEGRRYVEGGFVPTSHAELSTDRSAVLDAATFSTLWREPARGAWMSSLVEIWKRDFAGAYLAEHSRFRDALTTVAERVDGESAKAAALVRLNGLARLGPPVAVAALGQLHDLERLYPCAIAVEALTEALRDTPRCPSCDYVLGQAAPLADARRVLQAVERGLTSQQTRLARRVVSRIIAQPGASEDEKIERFIRVVQASDVAGLALILDDALVGFLRDLLESPAAPDAVLSLLVRAYPEVTAANLDAAVAEFRRLLEADLGRGAASVPLNEGRRA